MGVRSAAGWQMSAARKVPPRRREGHCGRKGLSVEVVGEGCGQTMELSQWESLRAKDFRTRDAGGTGNIATRGRLHKSLHVPKSGHGARVRCGGADLIPRPAGALVPSMSRFALEERRWEITGNLRCRPLLLHLAPPSEGPCPWTGLGSPSSHYPLART